jgi:tripartite-type tricarboxylate transporter receptor subunit TctC
MFSGPGGQQALEVGNNTELRQKDPTLVARVILETLCLVITSADNTRADTIEKVVAALQADPKSLTFGGSMPPGEDYLSMILLCDLLGIDGKECKYVFYDGGGETIPALMGGHVDLSFSALAKL